MDAVILVYLYIFLWGRQLYATMRNHILKKNNQILEIKKGVPSGRSYELLYEITTEIILRHLYFKPY